MPISLLSIGRLYYQGALNYSTKYGCEIWYSRKIIIIGILLSEMYRLDISLKDDAELLKLVDLNTFSSPIAFLARDYYTTASLKI